MSYRRVIPGLLVLVLMTTLLLARTQAGEENRDLRLASRAMQKLAADPQLKSLNLIVSVKNGVATLRGPVPTQELGQRAVKCLQAMPEISAVHNQCSVGRQFDPPLAVVEPKPGKVVAGPPFAPRIKKEMPSANKPSATDTTAVTVLPTIQIGVPTPTPEVIRKISRPGQPEKGPVSLQQYVQRLAQQDARYYRLQLEVRAGTVFINGVVTRWEDVHTLSHTLTGLPGVERVVWQKIRTEGNR